MIKAALIGSCIALIAISFFVFGVDQPKVEWGRYWMIKPLILTPLFGGFAGMIFYQLNFRKFLSFNKSLKMILSSILFIAVLWVGIVLGLNGTMWD